MLLFLLLLGCATSVTSSATTTTGCTSPPCRKILCLHGGGMTGPSFREMQGMKDLVARAGAKYEFVFLTGPYKDPQGSANRLWIRDPPGGKGSLTITAPSPYHHHNITITS